MFRTHNCGELRKENIGQKTILSGWVQRIRDKGSILWVDLRDRYGLTQLIFEEGACDPELIKASKSLGREFVIRIEGEIAERYSKNPEIPTGEIEIRPSQLEILSKSLTPPFTIEEDSDGGEEIRMKYRYLDLRRSPMQKNIFLRHKLLQETRKSLDSMGFLEVETPFLIKSTPEGARDYVVPSRVHSGKFYALPQSPQTFKQLLMVSGFDKYFQIVKCFRDEDLRADRQPEFTQIDCEMSFVEIEDIMSTFESLIRGLFKTVLDVELPKFAKLSYQESMKRFGNDRPDTRFEMELCHLNGLAKGKGFKVFDNAEEVIGILVPGAGEYSRKQLDELTEFVRKPQVGAGGLVYVKESSEGEIKSSVDKFFSREQLSEWIEFAGGGKGDLLLILAGARESTLFASSELRLELGERLGLRKKGEFQPLWVYDFPMFEKIKEEDRFHALHHPFTSPRPNQLDVLDKDPGSAIANAYDMVINGVEVGGGSIRIHQRDVQEKVFSILGFSEQEAQDQFGFLMKSFEYGAPPHGGIAFGFDRLCALIGGSDSIRDYIAFPKNNAGKDVMLDSPSKISDEQLDELNLKLKE
jgi:aspartyl-tRNA synthetase